MKFLIFVKKVRVALISPSAALFSTFDSFTTCKFLWKVEFIFILVTGNEYTKAMVEWFLKVLATHLPVFQEMPYRASNVIKSSLWPRLVCRRNSPLIASRYGVFRESVYCACIGEPLSSRARKHIKELPGGLQRPICPGNFASKRLNP